MARKHARGSGQTKRAGMPYDVIKTNEKKPRLRLTGFPRVYVGRPFGPRFAGHVICDGRGTPSEPCGTCLFFTPVNIGQSEIVGPPAPHAPRSFRPHTPQTVRLVFAKIVCAKSPKRDKTQATVAGRQELNVRVSGQYQLVKALRNCALQSTRCY